MKGYLNDLWKYDLDSNKWIWISGDDTSNQVRNINNIGSRFGHTMVLMNNYLYIFGGFLLYKGDAIPVSDLWRYDIKLNNWTLLSQWVSRANHAMQILSNNSFIIYGGVTSSNNCMIFYHEL